MNNNVLLGGAAVALAGIAAAILGLVAAGDAPTAVARTTSVTAVVAPASSATWFDVYTTRILGPVPVGRCGQ